MPRLLLLSVFFLALAGGLTAAVLPVTPYTVVAKVSSLEHYRAYGGSWRFGAATPYGNEETIVAIIVQPESLAGREIAVPFESKKVGETLLVKPGTMFRFEHHMNLADLRSRTDWVRRQAIAFPRTGILVLKPDGEVAESYPGLWSVKVAAGAKPAGAAR